MKANILVVDDELLLRDVLYDFLTKKSYNVHSISNPYKAIELVKDNNKFKSDTSIHLALVDVKMPEMSGLELTKELKKIDPNLGIIIMTGYPSINTALNALKNGASEYIVKPFRLDELTRIIEKNLLNIGKEYENIILKERIKQLEEQINKPENEENKTDSNISEAPFINRVFSEQRMNTEYDKEKKDIPYDKGIKAYKEKSNSGKDKQINEKIYKLEKFFEQGIIDKKEYMKKKSEILAEKNNE